MSRLKELERDTLTSLDLFRVIESPDLPYRLLATGRRYHVEQQLAKDIFSIGGDYYLTAHDISVTNDLVFQFGSAMVLLDTATRGGNPQLSKDFAREFMNNYYRPDIKFAPKKKASFAYNAASAVVGGDVNSTFTYLVLKGSRVYVGGVGTNTVIRVKENNVRVLFDGQAGKENGKTQVIASGPFQSKKEQLLKPGDIVYAYTDGFNGDPSAIEKIHHGFQTSFGDDFIFVAIEYLGNQEGQGIIRE